MVVSYRLFVIGTTNNNNKQLHYSKKFLVYKRKHEFAFGNSLSVNDSTSLHLSKTTALDG
jgi:hypothetical protein